MLDDADMVCRRIAWWCSTRRPWRENRNQPRPVPSDRTFGQPPESIRRARRQAIEGAAYGEGWR